MKSNNKICVSKRVFAIVLGGMVVIGITLFSTFLSKSKTSSNTRASAAVCTYDTYDECKSDGCSGLCTLGGCSNGMYQCKAVQGLPQRLPSITPGPFVNAQLACFVIDGEYLTHKCANPLFGSFGHDEGCTGVRSKTLNNMSGSLLVSGGNFADFNLKFNSHVEGYTSTPPTVGLIDMILKSSLWYKIKSSNELIPLLTIKNLDFDTNSLTFPANRDLQIVMTSGNDTNGKTIYSFFDIQFTGTSKGCLPEQLLKAAN